MVQGVMRRALALAVAVAAMPAGTALAATGHTYSGQFGGPGGDPGQIVSPSGIAVHPSGAPIYVADNAFGVVQAFNGSGDPGLRFDGSSTPATNFSPSAIATDGTSIWVADAGNNVVDQFDTSGAYVSQLDGSGTPAGSFAGPGGVAVDTTVAQPTSGYLYVADSGNNVVDVFDTSGAYVSQITEADGTPFARPTSVAVDGDGDVYVLDADNGRVVQLTPGGASFTRVVDRGRTPQAVATDPSTDEVYVGNIAPDGRYFIADHEPSGNSNEFGFDKISFAQTLAVSPTSHTVYAGDIGNSVVQRFHAITLPDVTTGSASSITTSTADLNGTIDPLTVDSGWRFDYGLDTTYGNSSGGGFVPAGDPATPVTDSIADLQPNATYHFRLVGMGPSANELGADETFTTDPAPPVLGRQGARDISQTSATLWAKLNPNNTDTTYHFDLGTDTSYGLGPVPTPDADLGAGYGLTEGSVDVAGAGVTLTPDTTYHYRVVATNGVGAPVIGSDRTFRTLPVAPTAVTGEATDVTAHSATVSGTVDPGGTGAASHTTYRFQYGKNTNYAEGYAPADPADVGSGVGASSHSATISGLAPNTTYHYRLLATNGAGTVAGADRTFTTPAAPPVVAPGAASGITASSATVATTIDPGGLNTSWVLEVGTDTSYGSRVFGDSGSGAGPQDVAVALGSLAPGTTYHYRFVATNADGTTTGADATFTTLGFSLVFTPPTAALMPVPTGPGRDLSPTPPAKTKPAVKPKHKKKSKKQAKKKRARHHTSTQHRKGKKS